MRATSVTEGSSIDLVMRELVLRLRYTFGEQLQYVGTTTVQTDESSDIDVLVVLTQMSDVHIRHVWSIINQIRINWNVFLDCRIRTLKDLSSHTLLEGYLLHRFLKDYFGKNPFSDYESSSTALRNECYKQIEQQEHRVLAMVPKLVTDPGRISEICQCVYDAIRAFLVLEDKPCVSKKEAGARLCEISRAFEEVLLIYYAYKNVSAIIDVPGFIVDSLALIRHLSYRARSYPLSDEVLLINTPSAVMPHPLDDRLGFDANMPLGLVCLASYLSEQLIPVKILDAYAKNLSAAEVVDEILKDKRMPIIIGFNTASPNIDVVHKIAKYLKRINKDVVLVCGGPHATLSTSDTLSKGFIDYAIVGEGEIPFLKLVQFCRENNRQIAIPIEGVYSLNSSSSKIEGAPNNTPFPLDKLPLPQFEHLPLEDCYFTKKRRLYLHTTRGCNFKCVYCSVHKFWGGTVRRVPLVLLFVHLEKLIAKYHPDEIQIVDDNFSHERGKIIRDFSQGLLDRGINIRWKCQVRADQLDKDIISLMKRSNCFEVDIGVESGNKDVQKLIKKNLDLDQTKNILKELNLNGITTKAFFVLGFVDETYEQLSDTINYAIMLKREGLNDVAFFPAMPFPGTELAAQVEKIINKPVLRGAVMDQAIYHYRSFAMDRLRKYSAKPEVSANENFTPDELRLLVRFAYERFEAGADVFNLKNEFETFKSCEEALIYGS